MWVGNRELDWSFYFDHGRLRLVGASGRYVAALTPEGIRAELGPDAVWLEEGEWGVRRLVYAEVGFAYYEVSTGKHQSYVEAIEVFPPMPYAGYLFLLHDLRGRTLL